ncbi:MAG: cysteine desulfurase NifS [Hadesarchaea archaeon DG-33-1]|nr:MAG: cysteine desulfurase NifS [Hadesarchaea archaeon DG-33-1]
MKVYLDNGTTTSVAKEVLDAMLPYFTEKFGHPIFVYSLGQEAADSVEKAQKIIAKTINARPGEIIFTSGGTEANDFAIRGIAYANKKGGNQIITTKIENPSVLRVCEKLEKEGFKVDYLDVDSQGFVNLNQLRELISEKTALVSAMHVNDEIGTIESIEEIGRILREQNHKIYFHVNAAASYAKVPINVERMNIDALSISAHKIHGPKGVGALYLREGTPIEPITFGYISLFTLKPGTENVPAIVGFGKAAELAFNGFGKNVEHMLRLRDKLMAGIEEKIQHMVLHGPRGNKRSPANVNYSFKYVEGESVLLHLDLNGISVATGSACSTRKLEPSHVLTAIGVKPEVAHGAIRFTLSRYNTSEEIDYVLEVLPRVIENLRKISPLKPEKF